MINNAKRFALAAIIAACTFSISDISQQSFALTNNGSITTLGVPITEFFDSLATSGSTNTWVDNSTLPGWYSQFELVPANPTVYIANAGSTNNGAIYSYGTGTSTERALGSASSGTPGTIYTAVKLTNNTGATITSLDVSFVGEQWRNGGNVNAQTLAFQYRVGPSGDVTDANTPNIGWTAFTALDFVSPTTGAAIAALDGNAPANRTPKAATITLTANDGQEIWLRWADINDSGNDHGLAVDELSMTAHGGSGDSAPTVSMSSPAVLTNVPVDSTITLTFSEPVTADGAFAIQCGSPQDFTPSATAGTSFTLTPAAPLPYSASCSVTVDKDTVTDQDGTPDHMAASRTFTFTTAAAPQPLTASSPQAGAASLDPGANIVINFSRSVTANASAFSVSCPGSVAIGVSGSPGAAITLDPTANLPFSADCTVTADASQIFAAQAPTQMASNFTFTLHTASAPVATNILINEVDADTPGSPLDTAEFIELYDGGAGHTKLDGLVLVLYNGGPNGDFIHQSYASFDLDGFQTDDNGYFVLGNPGVNGAQIILDPNPFGFVQNGADAVALYVGDGSDFPNGTPSDGGALRTAGLVDAVVYDTDDADDAILKGLLNGGQPQVNENAGGDGANQSIARCDNGAGGARNTASYVPATPTPGATNVCPTSRPPSDIVISQVYGGGGNSGATYQNDYVELFNRGVVPVDIGGWSLQYAAAANGSGWDFNKQPLGGIVGPGEYYLIGLAASGTPPQGAVLPVTPNITGAINMSGTNGKIALVGNGETLAGTCPIFNPAVKDFVGYGTTADCGEGGTKAPTLSASTADYRKDFGNTDTDVNGSDFVTGAPVPRRTTPIQELGPFVFATDPSNGATDAPRDPTIVMTFTEPVDVDPDWYNVSCNSSGVHNSATVAGSGQFKDVTLNDTLTPGEQCTVTIFGNKVHDVDTEDSTAFSDTLPSDYQWSFTVATGTAPPYPSDVHLTFGNPSDAIADTNDPNNYLMQKAEFALSYDRDLGRPNWVSWHLSSEWTGTLTRNDTFRADPAVPADWYRVEGFDFSGTGFDRGHMTPNADRDKETSIPINQATFLMSNMVAQAPDNNQGPWAAFEGYLRTLTDPGTSEAYIIAGPAGEGGTGSNGGTTMKIANDHVSVPSATWKVALILDKGADDLSRVTCTTRTIAVIMPNIQGIRNDAWETFLTSVDAVEDLTGYDFFSNLPTPIQQCIEAGVNGVNPPLDSEPPAITCDAPDSVWHGDNVSLSCHAVDAASGLANPSNGSFTLMTSVVGGAEAANALTDTRTVCDKAGNCATAGPIGGNMIDRKMPSIVLTSPANGAPYQLNRSVIASYACSDAGSGAASCAGTNANGAAIDTATAGPKTFTVNATDAAGNLASVTVAYSVASNAISISNIPAAAELGGSFVPVFSYAGDGATSVTSTTPARCAVSGPTVTFLAKGECRLVSHAAATAAFDASTGAVQTFGITKQSTTISITNIPADAINDGTFTPAVAYDGDGTTHVRSETPQVCRVAAGVVKFVSGGTCTLAPRAGASPDFSRVVGDSQSFVVGPGAATIEIKNIPNKPKAGKSFDANFRYSGDGVTSVTSSTPSVCSVTAGDTVNFLAAGTCTITPHATATASYTETTGSPESFVVTAKP